MSEVYGLPAPVGGLNSSDPLMEMDARDCVEIENFIITSGRLELRNGYKLFARPTGLSDVRLATMVPFYDNIICNFFSSAVQDRVFRRVDADGRIFTLPIRAEVGFDSIMPYRHIGVEMENKLLMFCTEPNKSEPIEIDESYMCSRIVLTNPNEDVDPMFFKFIVGATRYSNRLFMFFDNSLSLIYCKKAYAVGGDVERLDLSFEATLGGHVVAIGEYTRGGTDNTQNMLVIYTSEGEVICYRGSDPSDVNTWELSGKYRIPEPAGKNCMVQTPDDLLLISKDGYYNVGELMGKAVSGRTDAFSKKISGAVTAASQHAESFDSETSGGVYYSKKDMLLINIPVQAEEGLQHIYSIKENAWTKFTRIQATLWCVVYDKLFFTDWKGNIFSMFEGSNDNGKEIFAYVEQAYHDFEVAENKKVLMLEMDIMGNLGYDVYCTLKVDCNLESTCRQRLYGSEQSATQSYWNEAHWGDPWGTTENIEELEMQKKKFILSGSYGRKFSVGLRVTSNTTVMPILLWYGTHFIFEKGDY